LIGLVIYNVVVVYIEFESLSSISTLFSDVSTALVVIVTTIIIFAYILIVFVHLPTHFIFAWKLLYDSISYLSLQGAYSHVMLIYAFCNVDNVSWGTKGNKGQRVQRYMT
jgi:chitin synthase